LLIFYLYLELVHFTVADTTHGSYASALDMYNVFCQVHSLQPLSCEGMESYIFHCFSSGDSNGRAMSAYSALLFWANTQCIPLNFPPDILLSLHAFKRLYKRKREVLWVTVSDLNSILAQWSEVQLPHWVLLTLSFFTLVRPSEILHIKWGEIFLPEKYIYLPWSKNDSEGNGTYVTLLPQAHKALSRLRSSLPTPPKK
jgi:integrase